MALIMIERDNEKDRWTFIRIEGDKGKDRMALIMIERDIRKIERDMIKEWRTFVL